MDGGGHDNICGVVVAVVFVDRGLERHAQQVQLWGIFCEAVVVEFSV